MKLERRLRALEARMNTLEAPVRLQFADGATQELRGRPGFVFDLLECLIHNACCGTEQAVHLDLIRQSVRSTEPDRGHMVDLVRAFLNGPAEQEPGIGRQTRVAVSGKPF